MLTNRKGRRCANKFTGDTFCYVARIVVEAYPLSKYGMLTSFFVVPLDTSAHLIFALSHVWDIGRKAAYFMRLWIPFRFRSAKVFKTLASRTRKSESIALSYSGSHFECVGELSALNDSAGHPFIRLSDDAGDLS
ncbi:hypothetical protein DPMN_184832 [Dreissena polymorpha]|uniref:Uncharacterized protein n=1 Tax=Dreissena polymorpha TaxID=45954 RepID=A0A9D4I881_DREPO|nr:hypothetical protein DPMN_184832 [Dreissena polymorpha]